jgi:putative transposase
VVPVEDQALRAKPRQISRRRPRWGYRRAHQLFLDDGWQVNRKRTQRLWRGEGLRVPQRRRKRQRLGISTVPADRLRAQRPDHVWAIALQWDQTADGQNLKLLHVVDEFTREALAIECCRRIDADHAVNVLDRLVAERRTAPGFVRCDNGPEITANALRDWCRFSGTGSAYTEPGSPRQNPYVESFGGRVRDELLAVELFSCLAEAQVLISASHGQSPQQRQLGKESTDWPRTRPGSSGWCWSAARVGEPLTPSSQPSNGRILLRNHAQRGVRAVVVVVDSPVLEATAATVPPPRRGVGFVRLVRTLV